MPLVTLVKLEALCKPGSAGAATSGLLSSAALAPAGSYDRLPYFYTDEEAATAETKTQMATFKGSLKQTHQSVTLAVLADAKVTGQGAVVTCDNQLIDTTVLEFTAHNKCPDGFEQSGGLLSMPEAVHAHVTTPCILIKRPWYRNFGHWLVDGAAILGLAADRIIAEQLTIVIGNHHGQMRKVVLDTIARFVPDAKVLEMPDYEIWAFDRLYYVSPTHVPPLFKSPAGMQSIKTAFKGVKQISSPPAKIFVARGKMFNKGNKLSRRLINEAEIYSLCERRGFELVLPENLSIEKQASLFASARAVVGVKGAALTNGVFCKPGTKIMVMSPSTFPDPFFWDLVAQGGCQYGEVFGPAEDGTLSGMTDFHVDVKKISAMLDAAGL